MLLNFARSALRQAPARSLRRGYADAAADRIKLTLALPHKSLFSSTDVVQVNLSAESGDMGILANHVPSIEQLKPGVVEVIESAGSGSKKWFVSGGFANIHPSNSLTINAVEAFPLEDFSPEAIRAGLQEAQRNQSSNDPEEKATADAEVAVFEALQHHVR